MLDSVLLSLAWPGKGDSVERPVGAGMVLALAADVPGIIPDSAGRVGSRDGCLILEAMSAETAREPERLDHEPPWPPSEISEPLAFLVCPLADLVVGPRGKADQEAPKNAEVLLGVSGAGSVSVTDVGDAAEAEAETERELFVGDDDVVVRDASDGKDSLLAERGTSNMELSLSLCIAGLGRGDTGFPSNSSQLRRLRTELAELRSPIGVWRLEPKPPAQRLPPLCVASAEPEDGAPRLSREVVERLVLATSKG